MGWPGRTLKAAWYSGICDNGAFTRYSPAGACLSRGDTPARQRAFILPQLRPREEEDLACRLRCVVCNALLGEHLDKCRVSDRKPNHIGHIFIAALLAVQHLAALIAQSLACAANAARRAKSSPASSGSQGSAASCCMLPDAS